MTKQLIYVKHKDEVFIKYKEVLDTIIKKKNTKDQLILGLMHGEKCALEWVLGIDVTEEEKNKEFSDKINELTNKGDIDIDNNTNK